MNEHRHALVSSVGVDDLPPGNIAGIVSTPEPGPAGRAALLAPLPVLSGRRAAKHQIP